MGGPCGLVQGAGVSQIRMEHGRIDVVSEHDSAPVGVGVGEGDAWSESLVTLSNRDSSVHAPWR